MTDAELVQQSERDMLLLESVQPHDIDGLDAKARRALLGWAESLSDARILASHVRSPILRAHIIREKAAAKRLLPYLRAHHH